jgi:hypothetical protein
MIVARAMHRAGVTCPSRGAAHVLRHSVASSLLRQGASLHPQSACCRVLCWVDGAPSPPSRHSPGIAAGTVPPPQS